MSSSEDDTPDYEVVFQISAEELAYDRFLNKAKKDSLKKQESLKIWDGLDENFQSILKRVILFSIEQAYSEIDDWLPNCITTSNGHMVINMALVIANVRNSERNVDDGTSLAMKMIGRSLDRFLDGDDSSDATFLASCSRLAQEGHPLSPSETLRLVSLVDLSMVQDDEAS